MKALLLVLSTALAILAVLAKPCAADELLIFSDEGLTDSTLVDDAPRIVNLYVVHTDFDYGTGVRFATIADPGFTGVWLGDASSYYPLGNSTTDLSIAYGACLAAPVLVVTISYQMYGTSAACSRLRIAPAAGFSAAICLSGGGCWSENACQTGTLHVNCPVATEPSTWGRVKALYRE